VLEFEDLSVLKLDADLVSISFESNMIHLFLNARNYQVERFGSQTTMEDLLAIKNVLDNFEVDGQKQKLSIPIDFIG
jgi:hypothetical protein